MKQFKRTKLTPEGFAHVELLVIIIVLVVVVLAGATVFQTSADKKYKDKIKPAYTTQSSEMKLVYASFNKPVFSSNNTTPANDAKDLTYINSVTKQAQTDTDSLSSQNSLFVLPGTTVLGSVNNTKKAHTSMKQYIADSNSFLANYQAMSTYTSRFEAIGDNQMAAVFNSLENFRGDTTMSELATDSAASSKALDATIVALKQLKPSADFVKLNSDMISDLTALDVDMNDIHTDATTNNAQGVAVAGLHLAADGDNLSKLAGTNVATMLQGNSHIHNQITKLEAENPLANL